MTLIYRLCNAALSLFSLLLLAYVILSWMKPAANRWTVWINRIVEPVISPVRKFLNERLPQQVRSLGIDWSPLVLWLLIRLLRSVLSSILVW